MSGGFGVFEQANYYFNMSRELFGKPNYRLAQFPFDSWCFEADSITVTIRIFLPLEKNEDQESVQSKRFQYTSFHVEHWIDNVAERSNYQKNIIKNYYENREGIALQRVQELVTELYLSDGKKREKHWKSLATHLAKLDVKQATIDHLIEQDDPQLAAQLVQKLSNAAG